jgi:hypothetical protein
MFISRALLKSTTQDGRHTEAVQSANKLPYPENPGSASNTAVEAAEAVEAARSACLDEFVVRFAALPEWLDSTITYLENGISLVYACLNLPQTLIREGQALLARYVLRPLALAQELRNLFSGSLLTWNWVNPFGDSSRSTGSSRAFDVSASTGFARAFDFSALGPLFEAAYDPYFVAPPDAARSPGPLLTAQVATQAVLSVAGAVPLLEFTTADDALAMRDAVLQGLDLVLDYAPDATVGPLMDARLAVAADLTTRGGSLPRIAYVTLPATQPALLAAYTIYGDAGRDEELVARNQVRHPGRVPGGVPLEVLNG